MLIFFLEIGSGVLSFLNENIYIEKILAISISIMLVPEMTVIYCTFRY